jgi:predicted lipoprotein with Yx(FWY)xxD motif
MRSPRRKISTVNLSKLSAPILALALALGVAACGDETEPITQSAPTSEANAPAEPTTTAAPAASTTAAPAVAVSTGETSLGQVLVGPDERTLYAFTNDTPGSSACNGNCAQSWPPVVVDGEWAVGGGLDESAFSTITREDGTLQLVAGDWPLYYFGGDAAPGDINGQGSGDVWFAVAPDGTLIRGAGDTGY